MSFRNESGPLAGRRERTTLARVGILTLHLHVNYGGILQAAALYRLLRDEGFEPVLLRKEPENLGPLGRLVRNILRRLPGQNIGGVRARALTRARHDPFIQRFLPNVTRPCHNRRQLRAATEQWRLDAVVVGSDQVWRAEYHQDSNYLVYFLDFVPAGTKKISYAASFGHSEWRYPDQLAEVSELLAEFDGVSVREQSGVAISQDILGRKQCDLVLDPTLMVDSRLYEEAAAPKRPKSGPSLVSYVLDASEGSKSAHRLVAEALPAGIETICLSVHEEDPQADIGHWLRAFMDADFVITDSYHGTIFSILFGKNFIAFGNEDRGLDRFTTLLNSLGLADRLVLDHDPSAVGALVRRPVDWGQVNRRLDGLRKHSKDYLLGVLGTGTGVADGSRTMPNLA